MMNRPSPPPPTYARSVAVATTATALERMPARMSGVASGSSTLADHLPPVHAHAACGVTDVGVDLGDADVGVREHGRDGEQHEREERRDRDDADASEVLGRIRDAEREHRDQEDRDRGHRPPDVRDVDRQEATAPEVPEHEHRSAPR